jgi:hypothetical protein
MAQDNGGEFPTSDDVRSGYISGVTFGNKEIQYMVLDGDAYFEGDILLGTADEMDQANELIERMRSPDTGPAMLGLVVANPRFRWPGGVVYYSIDPQLPESQRVHDAIRHWEENTNVQFRLRTDQRDHVLFQPGDGCAAHVGMRGGQQLILLGEHCTTGNAIHEIGHCVGLWHEHSREDRDDYVEVAWDNIKPSARHNFEQHITDGDDVYEYDYSSIMHYPHHAFALDPARPTIVCDQPIGQRIALSSGDVRTINAIYPRQGQRR